MKKLLAVPLFLILAGCTTANATKPTTDVKSDPNNKIFLVDSKFYDCVGVGPMQCMKVKELPAGEWSLFYDGIDGFDYKEGYQYKLEVKETKVSNPPADASSIKYTLIKVLEKK